MPMMGRRPKVTDRNQGVDPGDSGDSGERNSFLKRGSEAARAECNTRVFFVCSL